MNVQSSAFGISEVIHSNHLRSFVDSSCLVKSCIFEYALHSRQEDDTKFLPSRHETGLPNLEFRLLATLNQWQTVLTCSIIIVSFPFFAVWDKQHLLASYRAKTDRRDVTPSKRKIIKIKIDATFPGSTVENKPTRTYSLLTPVGTRESYRTGRNLLLPDTSSRHHHRLLIVPDNVSCV